MSNIDQELKALLDFQQGKIINATESKIIVSAGPGSGKTYTLVKKITKQLKNLEPNRGIIACSFTKEAAKQLQTKIEEVCDASESFIGTIDSFVLMSIINPYKNRLINHWGVNKVLEKLKIHMPDMNSISIQLTRAGRTATNSQEIMDYIETWKKNFINGIYEISFVSYLIANYLIDKFSEVREYLTLKYSTIYIDEAQDLNEFQHEFIETLVNKCDMNCVMIGDKNQSIYKFRGARPEQFYNLKNRGYKEYRITVSVRCHKSIIEFANAFVDKSYSIEGANESRAFLGVDPSVDVISRINSNYLILFETNELALQWYMYLLKNNINVMYSRPINIANKSFRDDYYDLTEEILKFYFNFENSNPKFIYRLEEFKLFLSNMISDEKILDEDLIDVNDRPTEYIKKVFNLLKIEIDDKTILEIDNQLSNSLYKNHYIRNENVNRIMTIHSAKGLEADIVFVRLKDAPFFYDDEYRRKLFVAFTRAKNQLFISFAKDSNIKGSVIEQDFKKILSKLVKR